MKKLLTLAILFSFSLTVYGQAPQKFNYQAVARDASGELIANQAISLQISIVSGSANGTIEYTETHQVTTNTYGLFTLEIGTGSATSGTFSEIDWSEGSMFLQVELDATGGTNYVMMGTSQLLSVPYALYAGNGSKWSSNASGIDYAGGNVGIGTTNPIAPLHINGIPTVFKGQLVLVDSENPSTSIESASSITGWGNNIDDEITGRLWAFGSESRNHHDFIIRNELAGKVKLATNGRLVDFTLHTNGNVGIGTDDPKAKLEVADGDVYVTDPTKGIILKSPNGTCFRVTIDDTGNFVRTQISCPQ
ncbi:MAG: hypothetical protein ACPGJS_05230 [Flammeovirgaceae bacterium]